MDYEINLVSLSTKKNELDNMTTKVDEIKSEYDSSYIKQISSSEISSLVTKATNSIERLQKGYKNSKSWFDRYVNEFNTLENNLASLSAGNLVKPTAFTGEFMDIFTKVTIPYIQTKTYSGRFDYLPEDIALKKEEFLGDVDDPNNYDTVNPNYRGMRKTMTMFDNKTGDILQDHATITMKPGETRVITVKLPTDTGMINEIHRTTADGGGAYRSGKYLHGYSDVDPDPNNVEWVRYSVGHAPKDKTILHNNYYEWVLTAYADGTVKASQTCEYTTDVSRGENLKAMINLTVEVRSDG